MPAPTLSISCRAPEGIPGSLAVLHVCLFLLHPGEAAVLPWGKLRQEDEPAIAARDGGSGSPWIPEGIQESCSSLPAWGHDSYSSSSRTTGLESSALQAAPAALVACHGLGGSACSARLVHSVLEGSKVFLGSPCPQAPVLNSACSLCSPVARPVQPECHRAQGGVVPGLFVLLGPTQERFIAPSHTALT